MGTDATIFARKSKRCMHFDRLYNLDGSSFNETPAEGCITRGDYDAMEATYRSISERLRGGVTGEEVLFLVECNLMTDDQSRYWNEAIREFVNLYLGDEFFVVTDHEDPDWHDVARRGKYVRVDPDRLYLEKS